MTLALADAVLEFAVLTCPEFGGPDDFDSDVETGEVQNYRSVIGFWEAVTAFAVCDYLVAQQAVVEKDLAVTHYFLAPRFDYQVFFTSNKDAHVLCEVGAVIDEPKFRNVCLKIQPPLVDQMVSADPCRTLTDRIRVATYLVRLGCDAIGRFGSAQSFLRYAVRTLRQLMILVPSEDADRESESSNHRGHHVSHSPSVGEATD